LNTKRRVFVRTKPTVRPSFAGSKGGGQEGRNKRANTRSGAWQAG